MEENNSNYDFNDIKKPVLLLAILPAIVIVVLAAISINQRINQLHEADKTNRMASFSRLLVEFSHHLAREQVAKTTLPQENLIEPWLNRTDEAWNSITSYYEKGLKPAEQQKRLLSNYIKRGSELFTSRSEERSKISKEQLDYFFRSPRLIIGGSFGTQTSAIYQQNLQALLAFSKAKVNVYNEGIIVAKMLKVGFVTQNDVEKLTMLIWNQDEFFSLFQDYANDKQISLYRAKSLTPTFIAVNALHRRILLRMQEYELLATIGYLGLIHDFKNYVIRGDEIYAKRFTTSYKKAKSIVRKMINENEENQDFINVDTVLDNYNDQLPIVQKLHKQGLNVEEIDRKVMVDDSIAEESLFRMSDGVLKYIKSSHWREIWESKTQQLSEVKNQIIDDLIIVSTRMRDQAIFEFYWFLGAVIVTLFAMFLASIKLYESFQLKIQDDFQLLTSNEALMEKKNEELSEALQNQQSNSEILSAIMTVEELNSLGHIVLKEIGIFFNDVIGIFYEFNGDYLHVIAAHGANSNFPKKIAKGSGIAGRCALEKRISRISPKDKAYRSLILGESIQVQDIVALPLIYRDRCIGVIETASMSVFTDEQIELLKIIAKSVSIQMIVVKNRVKISRLLESTKEQKTELEVQQTELQRANIDLEEKAQELYTQQAALESLNIELESSKREEERKSIELIEANNAKSMFLSSVSNDLRTPLNSILILSRMLERSEGSIIGEKEVKNAKIIHSAGEDLLGLIDDILDLAKIEAGQTSVTSESIIIREMLTDMNDLFEQVAIDKGIGWSIECDEDVPQMIISDRTRVEQVIKNLLSNAIKFTQEGSVELRVSVKADTSLVISVNDTGVGIDKHKQSKVFTAFEQEAHKTEESYEGTRLGLSISKSLALDLGGDLYLSESQPGVGSKFIFSLPIKITKKVLCIGLNKKISSEIVTCFADEKVELDFVFNAPSDLSGADEIIITIDEYRKNDHWKNSRHKTYLIYPEGEEISPAELLEVKTGSNSIIIWGAGACERLRSEVVQERKIERNLKAVDLEKDKLNFLGKRVLIVDDDLRNIFALKQVLEEVNIEVLSATNGADSLLLLEKELVDLVFMDIMMPKMSGYEAIRTLRQKPKFKSLPIIALTAKAMSSDRTKCLEAGASDYLSKPLDIEVVFTTLEKWFYAA